ncbi:RNA-binding (RRM/RBD/RNP motifs) family protein [Zea mays]|uniref:RNA-binding (RRM/RBD/RNP motifs) family protein n=1 Tax=Zea mays TaxID=4577 RepID=A0A1D6P4M5_MAIZE|nr:RNA-binding (RRM/RBD/RNP motifs) family protein [Zea mays]
MDQSGWPEMESGLQPVYNNIGHAVGPNRRTFFQNIWLCILILFFAPSQYLQCMFPCLIRA